MYRILFIHSSIDGHLGCCHLSAIVSNAATSAGGLAFCFLLRLAPCSSVLLQVTSGTNMGIYSLDPLSRAVLKQSFKKNKTSD